MRTGIHVCWPWVKECGNTFRLYVWVRDHELAIAFTPNSTFGRMVRKPDGTHIVTSRWVTWD